MSICKHWIKKCICLVNKSYRCSGFSSAKRNVKFCMFATLIIYLVQKVNNYVGRSSAEKYLGFRVDGKFCVTQCY